MKRTVTLLALAVLLGGCGFLKRTFGVRSQSAYREPGTTAVWGNWVLRTPDSTAFVGAENVQLALNPGTFTLTAVYPTRTISVTGTANLSERGVLTLVPSSSPTGTMTTGRSLNFMQGQPIALLASAAGNTLVFSPEHRDVDPTPSSVWHKMDAAKEAGLLKRTASTDSTRTP